MFSEIFSGFFTKASIQKWRFFAPDRGPPFEAGFFQRTWSFQKKCLAKISLGSLLRLLYKNADFLLRIGDPPSRQDFFKEREVFQRTWTPNRPKSHPKSPPKSPKIAPKIAPLGGGDIKLRPQNRWKFLVHLGGGPFIIRRSPLSQPVWYSTPL